MLETGDLPAKFCLCWANENWTRTWDGSESQVLVGQEHSPEIDAGLIDALAPHLADPRYLRVEGKPMLLIYRPDILVDPMRTTDRMRERALALGLGEIHLALVQSFGTWDPRGLGFDSAVEFPPHGAGMTLNALLPDMDEYVKPASIDPRPALNSYPSTVEWAMSKPAAEFDWFRGVMPSWDNSPRRGERGTVFVGDSPELFQTWLERALQHTYLMNRPSNWMVFVNAWNEWAEGAYLEPDIDRGFARLNSVRNALTNTDELGRAVRAIWAANPDGRDPILDIARMYYESSGVLAREVFSQLRLGT